MSEQLKKVTYTIMMPSVAVWCSIAAWLSIIAGVLMLVGAVADSGYGKPDQTGLFIAGFAVCFGAMLWFALARIITLLAQIAHNTARAEPPAAALTEQ